jgi:hypothetical protein
MLSALLSVPVFFLSFTTDKIRAGSIRGIHATVNQFTLSCIPISFLNSVRFNNEVYILSGVHFMVFLTARARHFMQRKNWTHNIKRIFIKCIILWLELFSVVWIFLIIHLKNLSRQFHFCSYQPKKTHTYLVLI